MITLNEATRIVTDYLNESELNDEQSMVVVESETIERPSFWVFFYESREFVETGKIVDRLAGNAPLIVDKYDGKIHVTGTAHSIEHYIANYERKNT